MRKNKYLEVKSGKNMPKIKKGSMTSGEIVDLVLQAMDREADDKEDEEKSKASHDAASMASAAASAAAAAAASASSATPGGGPTSGSSFQALRVFTPDLSGNDEERQQKTALQSDATALMADTHAVKRLQGMTGYLEESKSTLLFREAEKEPYGPLSRLLAATCEDPEKALQGLIEPSLVLMISRVRDALTKRLQVAVFKDKDVSERVLKAIKKIRTGNLKTIKLLHLIDCEDNGSVDQPFKQFETVSCPGEKMKKVFDRMQMIVSVDTPERALNAMQFFAELNDLFDHMRERGATWSMLGKFWKALTKKMAEPAAKHARGEGTGSERGIAFDVTWINDRTTAPTLSEIELPA